MWTLRQNAMELQQSGVERPIWAIFASHEEVRLFYFFVYVFIFSLIFFPVHLFRFHFCFEFVCGCATDMCQKIRAAPRYGAVYRTIALIGWLVRVSTQIKVIGHSLEGDHAANRSDRT